AQEKIILVWPEAQGRAVVLDVAGREVWSEAIRQTTSTWNTSGWAEGTYLVKWTGENGSTLVTRIAVAH
ncbi:MAG: T9SS type A sorting domain-containing protein, partial [Flavobacteriales bacterium]|nr:T9SS type A sorting domain-containing protein [Flavobacteriales bacterium]